MRQVRIAVPSKEYQRKRYAVWRLMELPGAIGYAEAKPLQAELEDEFAEAWGSPGSAGVVVKFPDTYCDVLRDLYELSRATASNPLVN